MKKEWRKHEKHIYLPKQKPVLIDVPKFNYFTIEGTGNPNDDFFGEYIAVLYSVSYAVRMSYKSNNPPIGYYEYTVFPLEGVWDIADKSKYIEGVLDKNNLAFELMIRQPEFITEDFAQRIIKNTKTKKPHKLLDKIEFKTIEEGKCVQMLHKGSYDDEPGSFAMMDKYCKENNLERISMKHREIYLNDARKTPSQKLKTVLRYKVKDL